jgi:hypothetical protein
MQKGNDFEKTPTLVATETWLAKAGTPYTEFSNSKYNRADFEKLHRSAMSIAAGTHKTILSLSPSDGETVGVRGSWVGGHWQV